MIRMELNRYARIPLELNGKPGDEVMILADSRTEPDVYESFAAAAFGMGMMMGTKHAFQWLRKDETSRLLAKDELAIGQMVLTKWSTATKAEKDLINKLLSHRTLNKKELKKTKKGLDQLNATYYAKNKP